MRKIRWLLLVLLLCLAAGLAALLADGLDDRLGHADVAIVPGSKVELDGRPSRRLAARLDKTLELYRAGWFAAVIVSGGTGKEGYDEAVVMRDYLLARGVPESAIVLDRAGVDTAATAANSALLMRMSGWTSAFIVTQYFHVPRTRIALRGNGVTTLYAAHADFVEWRDIYSSLRELLALPVYVARLILSGN